MVTGAFFVIPILAAVAAVGAGDVLATGFASASEGDKSTLFGALGLAAVPTLYLGIASLINVARFATLRHAVQDHYRRVWEISGRDAHTDHEIAAALRDDAELYREDHRRHVLHRIGSVFAAIIALLSIFDGATGAGDASDWDARGPRAGQFAYKLVWGLVVIGGGAAGIFFAQKDSAQVFAMIGVYVAINLLWWIPSLWRSVALRRVDAAWREGAAAVYARLPMDTPRWCAPRR